MYFQSFPKSPKPHTDAPKPSQVSFRAKSCATAAIATHLGTVRSTPQYLPSASQPQALQSPVQSAPMNAMPRALGQQAPSGSKVQPGSSPGSLLDLARSVGSSRTNAVGSEYPRRFSSASPLRHPIWISFRRTSLIASGASGISFSFHSFVILAVRPLQHLACTLRQVPGMRPVRMQPVVVPKKPFIALDLPADPATPSGSCLPFLHGRLVRCASGLVIPRRNVEVRIPVSIEARSAGKFLQPTVSRLWVDQRSRWAC